jgi:hypothetical protein
MPAARHAVAAHLGEPGRKHDERAHAGLTAFAGDVDHGGRRDGDHRKIHMTGHVADRAERRAVGERVGVRMHDVQPAAVTARREVLEHSGADRPFAARGTDQRHRGRVEHMRDRGDRRDAVAIVEAPDSVGIERCRKFEAQLTGPGRHFDREPGVAQDVRHLAVARVHGCRERADPVALGGLGKVREQDRADPEAVHRVLDLERDLRAI